MTPDQKFHTAVSHQNAGRPVEAEHFCRQVLAAQPNHPGALHLIGLLLASSGRLDEALVSLQRAAGIAGDATLLSNLGNVLMMKNQLPEAIAQFRRALSLDPANATAAYNLGRALCAVGDWPAAVTACETAARLMPNYADAHVNLSIALREAGRLDRSVAAGRRAVDLDANSAAAWNNLGSVLAAKREHSEAIAALNKAIALDPQSVEAHVNLGNALTAPKRYADAIATYHKALALRPNDVAALINLGHAQEESRQPNEAVATLRQATALAPENASAWNNLGSALAATGQFNDALEALNKAISLRVDWDEAERNIGIVLIELGRFDQAEASLRKSLAHRPDQPGALVGLGIACSGLGRPGEALAFIGRAKAVDPEDAEIASQWLFTTWLDPDHAPSATLDEHRRWNDRFAKPLLANAAAHANDRTPDRRLRIGYISGDFRGHVLAWAMLPLFRNHDHSQFEVFFYSSVTRPDDMTRRISACADQWRDIAALTDDAAAELIRKDRIDILIDLGLHAAGSRLLVTARKPAPVQIAFLGYPGTTGVLAVDYRLTDPYIEPPGEFDAYCSEKLIRLPHTYQCYDPLAEPLPDDLLPNELPARRAGFMTFGCLNGFGKVNDRTLQLWSGVLRAVASSRLLMLAPPGSGRQRVLDRLGAASIDSSRIEFVDRQSRAKYLQTFHRIDIALDTLPYSSHTTGFDGYWMGVPTVTLIGKTSVGRAGYTQLCNLGLTDLAAETDEQFAQIAARLAGDLSRLTELRATLRQRFEQSPLMDGNRFARDVEAAYRQVWKAWCGT